MMRACVQGLHKAADDVLERRDVPEDVSAYQHGWHDAMELVERILLPFLEEETPFGPALHEALEPPIDLPLDTA